MKSLEEVMEYQNKYIVLTFLEKYPHYQLTEAQADAVFDDVKRYLWLAAVTDKKKEENPDQKLPDISFTQSMVIIDDMWHEFILVTEHYVDFCQKCFGKYMHHPPAMPRWEENEKTMTEQQCYEIFLADLMSEVYDYLGEEVTVRWFDSYLQYSPTNYQKQIGHHLG